jgi:hypothetical protein
MARVSIPARSVPWRTYVGAGINVIGALISTILLALVLTELEIKFGINPADLLID